MTREWRVWWAEAEDQHAVAEQLLELGRSNHAILHALMAVELGAKSVRMAPALIRHLDLTIDELAGYTIDQLGRLATRHGHDAATQFDAPWHPDEAVRVTTERVASVEASLGVASGTMYEASRYPDRWPGGVGSPSKLVREEHARAILAATAEFLTECRAHLAEQLEPSND